MQEALVYLPTLALFSMVTVASAMMRHEMLILACIPPVFVAMIMGFVMAIYTSDTFGLLPTGGALLCGVPPGWWLARRLQPRQVRHNVELGNLAALHRYRAHPVDPVQRRFQIVGGDLPQPGL